MKRLTVLQAAAIAQCTPDTIRLALQSGALVGHQRVKGGRWLIKPEALEAWMDGVPYTPEAC